MTTNTIRKTGIILLLVLSLICTLAACSSKVAEMADPEETTHVEDMDPASIDDIVMEGIVTDLIRQMSLKDKVGQLFIISTDSLDYDGATGMTDQMAERLEKYHPGGVLFFGFNVESRDQISSFIKDINKHASIPLFIAVDEEGGEVARIANTEGMGTTKFPPMRQIGAMNDEEAARNVGDTIGREIHELGFNLDFAPVEDISTNEENTEIGNRSFGEDPNLVARMVGAEVPAIQANHVCATLKHFPGQGDTGEDTHRGAVELETTIDRLREVEFIPFKAGIEAGADLVMVSHVSVKSVTGQETPASLSDLMISDILREEMGFNRIVITDAMNMKSVTKFYDPDTAALMAIQAGCDIVLMPDDFITAYEGVLEAVKEGSLEEETIDQALARILTVKIRRGIYPLTSDMIRTEE